MQHGQPELSSSLPPPPSPLPPPEVVQSIREVTIRLEESLAVQANYWQRMVGQVSSAKTASESLLLPPPTVACPQCAHRVSLSPRSNLREDVTRIIEVSESCKKMMGVASMDFDGLSEDMHKLFKLTVTLEKDARTTEEEGKDKC